MTRIAALLLAATVAACGAPLTTEPPTFSPEATTSPIPAPTASRTATTPTPATPGVEPSPTPRPSSTPTEQPATPFPEPPVFQLTSPAFRLGEAIPVRYTCDGADDQLPLEWSGVPESAVELALIQHDPDAGGFVHWVVVGIPADSTSIDDALSRGARHGTNDFGRARYDGPCPPRGNHTYVTTLFALSEPLDLGDAPTALLVRLAAQVVTIAQEQLRGTYRWF